MVKTSTIICEFNPIHNGHKYVLAEARRNTGEDGCVIAVMSGNFTQRCTPAVYDKYTRASSAVLCGADIVLELPFPWCCSGVEDFALGGVYISAMLGSDSLTFGSESGDTEFIKSCADIKSSTEFVEKLRMLESEQRESGAAVLFEMAMRELGISSEHNIGANDKLGMEYMICGRKYGIDEFNVVHRDMSCMSAKGIRQAMFDGVKDCSDVAKEAKAVFDGLRFCSEERYNDILFSYARLGLRDVSGNLAYAKKTAEECATAEEFIRELPQKKLTLARMRREILFSLLNVKEMNKKSPPLYTVLLCANERGREFLKSVKKNSKIEIITKPADIPTETEIADQYSMLLEADKLYTLCMGERADKYIRSRPVII